MDKEKITEKLLELNQLMDKHKEEAKELFENPQKFGMTLAVCMSTAMQSGPDSTLLEMLETALASGYVLAKAPEKEFEALVEEFPNGDELAEILQQELASYFRSEEEMQDFLAQQEKGKTILQ